MKILAANIALAWCYWPCARMVRCNAENVIDCVHYSMHGLCPLKSRSTFVPAYGLNYLSGWDGILVGIRPRRHL